MKIKTTKYVLYADKGTKRGPKFEVHIGNKKEIMKVARLLLHDYFVTVVDTTIKDKQQAIYFTNY